MTSAPRPVAVLLEQSQAVLDAARPRWTPSVRRPRSANSRRSSWRPPQASRSSGAGRTDPLMVHLERFEVVRRPWTRRGRARRWHGAVEAASRRLSDNVAYLGRWSPG